MSIAIAFTLQMESAQGESDSCLDWLCDGGGSGGDRRSDPKRAVVPAELTGCLLMFCGMVISQVPIRSSDWPDAARRDLMTKLQGQSRIVRPSLIARLFDGVSADGDGAPVAVVLNDAHAANVEIGVAQSLGQMGDGAGFISDPNEHCVFLDRVPSSVVQDVQRPFVLFLSVITPMSSFFWRRGFRCCSFPSRRMQGRRSDRGNDCDLSHCLEMLL